MKKVDVTVCLVDYGKAADFFIALSKADKHREYVIITHLPSVYIKCIYNKVTTRLVCKLSGKSFKNNIPIPCLLRTRELVLDILKYDEAVSLFKSYVSEISNLESRHYVASHFFVWNGQTVAGEVCTSLRNRENKKTLYFEIANIRNKIFVDPWGVNARSKLYVCGEEYLKKINVSDGNGEYEEWRKQYVEEKRKATGIPQAKGLEKKNFSLLLDYIFTSTLGYKFFSKRSKKNKLGIKKKKPGSFLKEEELISDFVFFPGQVHDDTQLILNSSIGNVEAIREVVKLEDLPVIVKPHPAGSREEYSSLSDLITQRKVVISYRNTFELIEKAQRVYTINSTVGFEAKILGKEVIFLGRSLYEKLNQESLKSYVTNYLVEADFFSPQSGFGERSIRKIYERADIDVSYDVENYFNCVEADSLSVDEK